MPEHHYTAIFHNHTFQETCNTFQIFINGHQDVHILGRHLMSAFLFFGLLN